MSPPIILVVDLVIERLAVSDFPSAWQPVESMDGWMDL
jgi:hypothetical protein